MTNNSTKSRAAYREKLSSMGIPCTRDEIFGSAYASALYISLLPSAGTTFVIGSTGLETELASLSLPFIGGTSAAYNRAITAADYPAIASGAALDPAVDTVLVGLDQSLGYLKYAHAFAYLQRGARFLATNGDSTLPSAGALFPGAGSCCAPLVKMSGQEPEIMGKPSGRMLDVVLAMLQRDGYRGGRSRLCMIGDRLDTDIRFGIDGGLGGTLAVLTGVSRREEWEREGAEVVPGYYVDALADLNGPSSAPLSS